MKKLLAIGLIVLVVFTLALSVIVAGCGDDEGTDTSDTTIEGTDTTAGTDMGTETTVDLGTETTVAP